MDVRPSSFQQVSVNSKQTHSHAVFSKVKYVECCVPSYTRASGVYRADGTLHILQRARPFLWKVYVTSCRLNYLKMFKFFFLFA